MIGLNSKDLNESLSQMLGMEGKKEKSFFKEFKTQDRRQIRTKKMAIDRLFVSVCRVKDTFKTKMALGYRWILLALSNM